MSSQVQDAGVSVRNRRLHRKHKHPSQREAERRRRQAAQDAARDHRDRVLSFRAWCAVNAFSEATGRRIIERGEGPRVLQLSPRRIGIRESDNAAWQAARAR
jgi:predicted DNA-binding transcriptional regulator AlpA